MTNETELKRIATIIKKETKLNYYLIEKETNTIGYKNINYLYFLDILATIIYKEKLIINRLCYYDNNLLISFRINN